MLKRKSISKTLQKPRSLVFNTASQKDIDNLPGVVIGKKSICAACSVVTKDVEEDSIYAGVPARKIARRDRTIDYKLSFNSKYR